VSEAELWRKHALECLRLEADCKQLAALVDTPALGSDFLRMASIWSTLADRGPDAPPETPVPSS
jgi:hypothetical protein